MVKRTEERKQESAPSGSIETVTIGFDRLKLLLHVFVEKVRQTNDWIGPLGILLTVSLTLLITDFKDRLGLTGPQWQAVTGVGAFAALLWFVYALVQRFRVPSTDSLLKEIYASAIRRDEWRILFFLKCEGQDHLVRILVFRDPVWDCFVLPHMRYSPDTPLDRQEASFVHCIAGYLGMGIDQIAVTYMEDMDLTSVKHSERAHQETTYCFKFYVVVIHAEESKEKQLAKRVFEIGGKEFSWLTIGEMDAHVNTLKRNQDVTNHLTIHYDLFFSKAPNAMKQLITSEPISSAVDQPSKKNDRSMSAKK